MPSQEEFDELKGRIVELENQLKGNAVQRDVSSIAPEEMQTFIKVRDVLARDIASQASQAGITWVDPPSWPWILRCWPPCVPPRECFECMCGPCGPGQVGRGLGRFGGLGG